MGLKNFLIQQGFITDDENDKGSGSKHKSSDDKIDAPPSYFPLYNTNGTKGNIPDTQQEDPSFVTPLKTKSNPSSKLDQSFIKFFEDELSKSNFPGPDYFEFRQ